MGIAFLGILLLFAFRCMFHYKSYSVFICTNLYFQDQVVVYRLKYHVLYIIQSIKIVLFPVTITFVQIVISYFFFTIIACCVIQKYIWTCPWTPTFDYEWVLYVFWPLTFNVRYCIALIDCYMHHVKIKKRNKKQHYQKKIINLKMKIVIRKSKNFLSY